MPQEAAPAPADTTRLEAAPASAATRALPAPAPAAANARFLPPGLLPQVPQTNPNQGLQNTLAAGGLGAVGAVAASNCLFGGNCDLSFRPSLGAAVDANGQIVPQLGVTTQVGGHTDTMGGLVNIVPSAYQCNEEEAHSPIIVKITAKFV